MKDIFISYNWGSKEAVQKIAGLLRSKDEYQVWMDESIMNSGDNFQKEIQEGIDNCKIFIAFITQSYCESSNCQSEAHYAFDKKKKSIYVMLEENLGKDPTGIGLIVASSLRLNAYQFVNDKDWPENLYNMLSRDINQRLNDKESQKLDLQKIDLESLLKCSICNNRYNLKDRALKSFCHKPIQTTCNNVLCMKCVNERKKTNRLGNPTFLCPFDSNVHPLSKCSHANRLHNVIRFFETIEDFKNLKRNREIYDKIRNKMTTKRLDLVNESKRKIKEHVEEVRIEIEEIINEINNHETQLIDQLDKLVEECGEKQAKIKESLKIDEIIKSTEDSINQFENDLRNIEHLNSIDHHINLTSEKMVSLNDSIKQLNGQIKQELTKLTEQRSLIYENKSQENDYRKFISILKSQIGILRSRKLFVDIPQLVALCEAKEEQYLKIKKLIEEEDANVNLSLDSTALMMASKNGYLETVKLLIQNVANVNEEDKDGWTALMWASESGHLETVKFLIQNGGNVNKETSNDYTALMLASKKGYLEIVKLFIQNGANVNENDKDRWTALMLASESGHLETVKFLIQNGADFNKKNEDGYTALMLASESGHLETVKLLIEDGANVNEKAHNGYTALMLASKSGHLEIVKTLIQNGANVNEKDKYGWTALMLASESGHLEIVKSLIQNGANVNENAYYGYTALMLASRRNHSEVARFLIKNGADKSGCTIQ